MCDEFKDEDEVCGFEFDGCPEPATPEPETE